MSAIKIFTPLRKPKKVHLLKYVGLLWAAMKYFFTIAFLPSLLCFLYTQRDSLVHNQYPNLFLVSVQPPLTLK
jgi:hypothetical protein